MTVLDQLNERVENHRKGAYDHAMIFNTTRNPVTKLIHGIAAVGHHYAGEITWIAQEIVEYRANR